MLKPKIWWVQADDWIYEGNEVLLIWIIDNKNTPEIYWFLYICILIYIYVLYVYSQICIQLGALKVGKNISGGTQPLDFKAL